jgi:hypothetical protein
MTHVLPVVLVGVVQLVDLHVKRVNRLHFKGFFGERKTSLVARVAGSRLLIRRFPTNSNKRGIRDLLGRLLLGLGPRGHQGQFVISRALLTNGG